MQETLDAIKSYLNELYMQQFGGDYDQLDVSEDPNRPNYFVKVVHKIEGWTTYLPRKDIDDKEAIKIIQCFGIAKIKKERQSSKD